MSNNKNEPVQIKTRVPDLTQFVGRKIKNLRCSMGIHIGATVMTAIDAEKHQVEMIQGPMGVLVKKGNQEKMIYIGNLIEAELYPQE
jgi:hypothetical protein